MDITRIPDSRKSNDNINCDNTLISKLRRLKIQEQLLTTAVNKSLCNLEGENEIFNNNTELKKYLIKIRNSHNEIKNLFEDIIVTTKDQEQLRHIEIHEIKSDIISFEDKLKSFKEFVRKELSILKVAAKEIHGQLLENNEETKIKKNLRVQSRQFNEVVPSPVRVLIKSPFKCLEVQRLQDFMKCSTNRYGGWNEYNHNIFKQIWTKHFDLTDITVDSINLENFTFSLFRDEVRYKIAGIDDSEVISHSRWYIEYKSLKKQQDLALNKWRENKRKIKKHHTKGTSEIIEDNRVDFKQSKQEVVAKQLINTSTNSNISRQKTKGNSLTDEGGILPFDERENDGQIASRNFLKPTKQWKNRTVPSSEYSTKQNNFHLDKIEKLKIATWRCGL